MFLNEITARSIITKSNLPSADFVINPYGGCSHACTYCYASFMKRFSGHTESWGTYVDVKVNAADLIPEHSTKYKDKFIFLSSVTDPYLSLEKKYELTRKILTKLIPLEPRIGILTKSDLVLRDRDLLSQFHNCEVGLTITMIDDSVRREIEPFASSIKDRIAALKALKDAGLRTYVFIGPILPYFTDWKAIIEQTKEFADFYMFENLNVRGILWQQIRSWLASKHSDLIASYEAVYFTQNDYWKREEQMIRDYCLQHKIDGRVYFHHNAK